MKQQLAFRYAYAAGVIDSDGSIAICRISRSKRHLEFSRMSPSYRLLVTVSLCDARILDRFVGWFGGHLYEKPVQFDSVHHAVYRWEMTGELAAKFLKLIYPFLVYKQSQAEVGMAFQTHVRKYHQPMIGGRYLQTEMYEVEIRESYYQKMKALKHEFHAPRAVAETKRADSSLVGREAIVRPSTN